MNVGACAEHLKKMFFSWLVGLIASFFYFAVGENRNWDAWLVPYNNQLIDLFFYIDKFSHFILLL